MTSKIQSRKAKGRKLQQFIAEDFIEFFRLQEGDITSRSMGSQGEDLIFSPKARRRFPMSIEAKSTVTTPGTAALKQAKLNSKGFPSAVIWKPKGVGPEKYRIIMEREDFLSLINYYLYHENEVEEGLTDSSEIM